MIKRNNGILNTIMLLVIPFISYYIIKTIDLGIIFNFNIENIVGLIAIFSGITGIIMSLSSSKLATLNAIKEYYQQGDDEKYVKARKFISSKPEFEGLDDQGQISDIINFYELWGLLNSKGYLPLWVFGGVSGVRVVEMYIKLTVLIETVRDGSIDPSGGRSINPFYGKQFEELAYRIYRKYKENFKLTNFEEIYTEQFKRFKDAAKAEKRFF